MRNVYFYQLFFSELGKPKSNSVGKYLQSIIELSYQHRIVHIDGYPVVLSIKHVEPMTNLCFFTIVRFKNDSHLFKGSLTDEKLEEIKGDIAQLTTFLYDEKTNIMIEEYNHEGIKHKEILKYFNSFNQNPDIKLKTEQINENYTLETIQGSSRIASIEVKLKLDKDRMKLFTSGENRFMSISSVFDKDMTDTLGADVATLVFRKSRSDTLNIDSVISFLKLLNVEEEFIQSVNVQFKHLGKMVTMNLKNIDKPLKDTILEDSNMKNPFLVSIRDGLLNLYMDKHAGRFLTTSQELQKKMTYCTSEIKAKMVYEQQELIL